VQGVHIATFATISWETCTNSRNQAKLRAVFLLSDTFIKTYNLQQKKPLTPPLLSSCEDINFTKIAIKFSKNLTKDLVFCGVRDLLQKIGEIAASGAPMSIAFNCGRLIAKNRCISMIFDPLRFPRALEDEITRSMVGSPPSALGNLTDFDIEPEDQVELNLPSGRRESNGDAEQQQQQFSFETDGREAQPTNRSNPENLIPFEVSLEEELEMFGIIGSPGKGNPVMESAYKRHIASLAEDVDREAKHAFDLQLQQKRDLDTVALENRMRRLCAEDLQRQILVQMDERHHEKRQEKGTLRALDPSVCSFYCDGEQTRLGFDNRAYLQRNKQELKQHLQEQMHLKAMDRTDARQRHLAEDTMLLRRIRHEMDELDQKDAQKREDSRRVLTQAWHHDNTVKKLVETKKKQRVAEQVHKEGVAISPTRVNYYPNLPQPITPRLRRSSDDGDYSVGFDIRSACGD
jgi:hypothetical protein